MPMTIKLAVILMLLTGLYYVLSKIIEALINVSKEVEGVINNIKKQ